MGINFLLGGGLIIVSYKAIDFFIGNAISYIISVAKTGDYIFVCFDLIEISSLYDYVTYSYVSDF